jgi:hypothetical protein
MYDRSRVDKYCSVLAARRGISLYQFYVNSKTDKDIRVVYRRLKVISLFENRFI